MFEVSLAGGITTAIFCTIISHKAQLNTDSILIRTALAAIWLPALALFLHQNSSWSMAAIAILTVVLSCSLFGARTEFPTCGSEPASVPEFFSFQLTWRPQVSVLASLGLELAILGYMAGYSMVALLLTACAFAIWTWSFYSYADPGLQLGFHHRPAQLRNLSAAILAFILVVIGLTPYLGRKHGWGNHEGKYAWHPSSAPRSTGALANKQEDISPRTGTSEGNTGIVLWPEKEIVTRLVAPPPMRQSLSLENLSKSDPLIVPFNGVYWFFRSPDVRPPRTSRQAHASPDAVEIRSTDRSPLSVEAYDHLGTLIDLDCCSKIQIAIRNADRYPETVTLELVLVNTSLPQKPSQSLGSALVHSTQSWKIYEKPKPSSETLNYAIPVRRSLRRFDELKIIFQLNRARADAAARIAIDHFVLVPRGL